MHSFSIDTPRGPAGIRITDSVGPPRSQLVLGHGAGGGPNAADLELLAQRLPTRGTTVVRFEQPWRTAGRRVAVPPAQLDEAWLAAIARLERQPWATDRLFVGGRSAGARVACRTADQIGAAGVVCLAFPLHLPGRPERSRLAELLAPTVDRLVLQGTRDAFGSAAEIRLALDGAQGITVIDLPGADHGYRLPKTAAGFTAADLRTTIVDSVADFVAG